ncbi:MAG: hypothetical protein IKH22_02405 [Prevotella sp.]|nr:hypothetical protein [Prevotella sp.]
MKKKYYLLMAAFVAICTFSLTACGDEDDDKPKQGIDGIEINGTNNVVMISSFGWMDIVDFWNGDIKALIDYYGDDYLNENEAFFAFQVIGGDYYSFSWTSPYEPKRGDVISNMNNFILETDIIGQEKEEIEYTYSKGTAKIVDTNVSKEEITIQFDNLKMTYGNKSYTFNGKITFSYVFSELTPMK